MARHRRRAPSARRSVVAPLAWGTAALGVVAGGAATVTTVLPTPSVTAASLRLPDPALPDPVQPVLGGPRLIAVEPVAVEPRVVDATDLVKAVRSAESRRAPAVRPQAPPPPPRPRPITAPSATTDCGLNTSGLGAVKPHVRAAAQYLGCRFGEPTMYGVAGRAGTSDHPTGLAVDFMVDRATGDRLAACALANRGSLGITYVIWRQRINFGSGWQPMEDRGGITANHFDHVHVSFGRSAGGGPTAC